MIDTDKYENMRLLFLDFIDTASDEVDEGAWRDKLTMLDDLLAEVKQFHNFDEYIIMLRNGQIDADDICDVWDEIRKEREE